MRKFLVTTVSSFFYLGFLPLIPGTFGSLAGLFLFYLVKGSVFWHLILILILLGLGFWSAGRAERASGKKDPRFVVIDEAAGMLIALLFIPYKLSYVLLAFLFFRLLDTLKPFPASKLQNSHGSVGIMADDIVAGIYANLALQLTLRLVCCKTS